MSYELRITNIRGMIGINQTDALLSIRQPRADLEISSSPPQLNMHTEHLRIKIDQSQCFSEAGLKGVLELTGEFAKRGQQAALEAIGTIISEGNRMANIVNKADAIAEIAAERAVPPPAETNIVLMPTSRPKIEFEGGLSFDPEAGQVNIRAKANPPEINVQDGSLEIYLLQRPEFRMEFVGQNVDITG